MQRLPPAFLIAVTMAQIPGCHLGRPTGAAAWCRLGGNAFARPWTQAAGPWLRMRASSPNHARGVAAKSGGDASPATTAAAAAPAVEPKLNHAGPPLPPASSFRRPARIADVLGFTWYLLHLVKPSRTAIQAVAGIAVDLCDTPIWKGLYANSCANYIYMYIVGSLKNLRSICKIFSRV